MNSIRPVRPGILIGLLGILFGIGWAFWLVLGHERLHASLEAASLTVVPLHEQEASHNAENQIESAVRRTHNNGAEHMHVKKEAMPVSTQEAHGHGGGHNDALTELPHPRLTRGHLHAMGLGLGAIIISFILAFTSASGWIKIAASTMAGLGGLIYPLAWIAMGYRTPSLGPEMAEASVTVIAAPGVGLFLAGALTAVFFVAKDMLMNKR